MQTAEESRRNTSPTGARRQYRTARADALLEWLGSGSRSRLSDGGPARDAENRRAGGAADGGGLRGEAAPEVAAQAVRRRRLHLCAWSPRVLYHITCKALSNVCQLETMSVMSCCIELYLFGVISILLGMLSC